MFALILVLGHSKLADMFWLLMIDTIPVTHLREGLVSVVHDKSD